MPKSLKQVSNWEAQHFKSNGSFSAEPNITGFCKLFHWLCILQISLCMKVSCNTNPILWASSSKREMKPKAPNPAGKRVSPIKPFRWRRKEKKRKKQGRGGGRTTQQAIHLFTKSYGSWKVEKHHRSSLNKSKNEFSENQH